MSFTTHRAGWIIIDPWTILNDGFVQVESGKILAYGQGRSPLNAGKVIDHGPGALMPALVNAHTHLELTALKNKTNLVSGFIEWVKSVIVQRDGIGRDALFSAAADGIKEMLDSGTLFIGEISSLGITKQLFLDSAINGVWFKEHIGLNGESDDFSKISTSKKISVSGHAPHTTAPSLLVQLKQQTNKYNLPFSIHLAESEAEVEFIESGKGLWADLLRSRGIDISGWDLTANSPVQYVDYLGLLDDRTIAVHLLHHSAEDLDILSNRGVKACVCPRSNMKIHRQLPDLPRMIKSGIKPCLGTDSLASNDSLSMLDEMRFTNESFPGISPEEILAMATVYGSAALGIDSIAGSLQTGKQATFMYASIDAQNRQSLLEKLVYGDLKEKAAMIHHEA
jgi:aminodeoxyfutalosine deaminase